MPCEKQQLAYEGLKNIFEKLGNHFLHFGAWKPDAF